MNKQTKDLIFLGAAVLGAYAAWLTIREKSRNNQAFSDWFTQGAFKANSVDFYDNEVNQLLDASSFINNNRLGAL